MVRIIDRPIWMKWFGYKPACLLVLLLWAGLIVAGYAWLLRYNFAAGNTLTAPGRLPPPFGSPGGSRRPQLFIALHPRCPCSRATVAELAKILSRAPNAGDVTVLMYRPADRGESWLQGPLLDECRRMKCMCRPDLD